MTICIPLDTKFNHSKYCVNYDNKDKAQFVSKNTNISR